MNTFMSLQFFFIVLLNKCFWHKTTRIWPRGSASQSNVSRCSTPAKRLKSTDLMECLRTFSIVNYTLLSIDWIVLEGDFAGTFQTFANWPILNIVFGPSPCQGLVRVIYLECNFGACCCGGSCWRFWVGVNCVSPRCWSFQRGWASSIWACKPIRKSAGSNYCIIIK